MIDDDDFLCSTSFSCPQVATKTVIAGLTHSVHKSYGQLFNASFISHQCVPPPHAHLKASVSMALASVSLVASC